MKVLQVSEMYRKGGGGRCGRLEWVAPILQRRTNLVRSLFFVARRLLRVNSTAEAIHSLSLST